MLADDKSDNRDSRRESFASESVAPEDRIKELPDVRHSKTGAGAPKRAARQKYLFLIRAYRRTETPGIPHGWYSQPKNPGTDEPNVKKRSKTETEFK
jgi:hypothetical protein